MKTKAYIFLMFFLIPTLTHADYLTGNDVMDSWDNKYLQSNSMVRGYFAGVLDSNNGVYFCVEADIQMNQVSEVIIQHIKENPKKWHKTGKSLVIEALSEAFPCSDKSNKQIN